MVGRRGALYPILETGVVERGLCAKAACRSPIWEVESGREFQALPGTEGVRARPGAEPVLQLTDGGVRRGLPAVEQVANSGRTKTEVSDDVLLRWLDLSGRR